MPVSNSKLWAKAADLVVLPEQQIVSDDTDDTDDTDELEFFTKDKEEKVNKLDKLDVQEGIDDNEDEEKEKDEVLHNLDKYNSGIDYIYDGELDQGGKKSVAKTENVNNNEAEAINTENDQDNQSSFLMSMFEINKSESDDSSKNRKKSQGKHEQKVHRQFIENKEDKYNNDTDDTVLAHQKQVDYDFWLEDKKVDNPNLGYVNYDDNYNKHNKPNLPERETQEIKVETKTEGKTGIKGAGDSAKKGKIPTTDMVTQSGQDIKLALSSFIKNLAKYSHREEGVEVKTKDINHCKDGDIDDNRSQQDKSTPLGLQSMFSKINRATKGAGVKGVGERGDLVQPREHNKVPGSLLTRLLLPRAENIAISPLRFKAINTSNNNKPKQEDSQIHYAVLSKGNNIERNQLYSRLDSDVLKLSDLCDLIIPRGPPKAGSDNSSLPPSAVFSRKYPTNSTAFKGRNPVKIDNPLKKTAKTSPEQSKALPATDYGIERNNSPPNKDDMVSSATTTSTSNPLIEPPYITLNGAYIVSRKCIIGRFSGGKGYLILGSNIVAYGLNVRQENGGLVVSGSGGENTVSFTMGGVHFEDMNLTPLLMQSLGRILAQQPLSITDIRINTPFGTLTNVVITADGAFSGELSDGSRVTSKTDEYGGIDIVVEPKVEDTPKTHDIPVSYSASSNNALSNDTVDPVNHNNKNDISSDPSSNEPIDEKEESGGDSDTDNTPPPVPDHYPYSLIVYNYDENGCYLGSTTYNYLDSDSLRDGKPASITYNDVENRHWVTIACIEFAGEVDGKHYSFKPGDVIKEGGYTVLEEDITATGVLPGGKDGEDTEITVTFKAGDEVRYYINNMTGKTTYSQGGAHIIMEDGEVVDLSTKWTFEEEFAYWNPVKQEWIYFEAGTYTIQFDFEEEVVSFYQDTGQLKDEFVCSITLKERKETIGDGDDEVVVEFKVGDLLLYAGEEYYDGQTPLPTARPIPVDTDGDGEPDGETETFTPPEGTYRVIYDLVSGTAFYYDSNDELCFALSLLDYGITSTTDEKYINVKEGDVVIIGGKEYADEYVVPVEKGEEPRTFTVGGKEMDYLINVIDLTKAYQNSNGETTHVITLVDIEDVAGQIIEAGGIIQAYEYLNGEVVTFVDFVEHKEVEVKYLPNGNKLEIQTVENYNHRGRYTGDTVTIRESDGDKPVKTDVYYYNKEGKLKRHKETIYEFDENGDCRYTSNVYGPRGRRIGGSEGSQEYDEEGNLISESISADILGIPVYKSNTRYIYEDGELKRKVALIWVRGGGFNFKVTVYKDGEAIGSWGFTWGPDKEEGDEEEGRDWKFKAYAHIEGEFEHNGKSIPYEVGFAYDPDAEEGERLTPYIGIHPPIMLGNEEPVAVLNLTWTKDSGLKVSVSSPEKEEGAEEGIGWEFSYCYDKENKKWIRGFSLSPALHNKAGDYIGRITVGWIGGEFQGLKYDIGSDADGDGKHVGDIEYRIKGEITYDETEGKFKLALSEETYFAIPLAGALAGDTTRMLIINPSYKDGSFNLNTSIRFETEIEGRLYIFEIGSGRLYKKKDNAGLELTAKSPIFNLYQAGEGEDDEDKLILGLSASYEKKDSRFQLASFNLVFNAYNDNGDLVFATNRTYENKKGELRLTAKSSTLNIYNENDDLFYKISSSYEEKDGQLKLSSRDSNLNLYDKDGHLIFAGQDSVSYNDKGKLASALSIQLYDKYGNMIFSLSKGIGEDGKFFRSSSLSIYDGYNNLIWSRARTYENGKLIDEITNINIYDIEGKPALGIVITCENGKPTEREFSVFYSDSVVFLNSEGEVIGSVEVALALSITTDANGEPVGRGFYLRASYTSGLVYGENGKVISGDSEITATATVSVVSKEDKLVVHKAVFQEKDRRDIVLDAHDRMAGYTDYDVSSETPLLITITTVSGIKRNGKGEVIEYTQTIRQLSRLSEMFDDGEAHLVPITIMASGSGNHGPPTLGLEINGELVAEWIVEKGKWNTYTVYVLLSKDDVITLRNTKTPKHASTTIKYIEIAGVRFSFEPTEYKGKTFDGFLIYNYKGRGAASVTPGVWLDETTTTQRTITQHNNKGDACLLYTSPSPRDLSTSRMPSSA